MNSRFCSKTRYQMFLLVSVRHVGAHPGGHQHGVSIQISINLGKTFLRISRIRNIPLTWILARVFAYLPPFISQILDFIYGVLLFILIYFEWRDTENYQSVKRRRHWKDYISYCFLKPQPRLSPRLLYLSMIFSVAYKRSKVSRKVIFFLYWWNWADEQISRWRMVSEKVTGELEQLNWHDGHTIKPHNAEFSCSEFNEK